MMTPEQMNFSVSNQPVFRDRPEILFVDDDRRILDSLGNVLKSIGYQVSCEHDSSIVLDVISKREFDLVLTDLKMDGPNGFDILKAVRLNQPNTPVVILTGYATLYSAIEALQAGAYDYLVKPCNIKEMQMTVDRGIKQKRIKQERDHYLTELQLKNIELEQAMEQLTIAHKKLKESEEFRETMVSMFTHDLFNPVTTVKGFLNILIQDLHTRLDENSVQYFGIVQRNVKKLEMLLQTFQSLYKIDSHTYRINPQIIDLRTIMNESIRNVELFAKERQIQQTVSLPQEPVSINGDSLELERAISNIILNAIKFSPRAGLIETTLSIRDCGTLPETLMLQQTAAQFTKWALVEIHDNGPGISQDDQQKIFNKRFRGTNADRTEGSGIGLFISRFIVQLHDGAIAVASESGKGSTFSIYLPLAAT